MDYLSAFSKALKVISFELVDGEVEVRTLNPLISIILPLL